MALDVTTAPSSKLRFSRSWSRLRILKLYLALIWGFPKIRGTILGVPIIRTIVFLGLYWGSPILRNYHL